MKAAAKLPRVGPFQGINNRLPDSQLRAVVDGKSAGDFLRDAVNVDQTDAGTLRSRPGYALARAGQGVRSLFGLADGSALCLEADVLLQVKANAAGALSAVALLDGLSTSQPMSYAEQGGVTYLSNGAGFWRFDGDQIAVHGLPVPAVAPSLESVPGGALPAGIYQAVLTYRNAVGEESGTSLQVAVEVAEASSLVVGGLPTVLPEGVAQVVVYLTPCNGDVFYQVAVVGAGAGDVTVSVAPAGGTARCQTARMQPLPAGRIVRWHQGRLLSAVGAVLYKSQPYSLGLYDPVADFVMFPGDITVVASVPGGLYVCADKTYFINGDFESMRELLPYGAAFGSDVRMPDDKSVAWFSPRGVVMADMEGAVVAPQDDKLAFNPAEEGASLVREQNGTRQIVSALRKQPGGSVAAAASYMEATVIRNGDST